jgi:hypothetical protein
LLPSGRRAAQLIAPKISEERLELHRCGTQDGIERIDGTTLQAVALQPVFVLQMSDALFNRRRQRVMLEGLIGTRG